MREKLRKAGFSEEQVQVIEGLVPKTDTAKDDALHQELSKLKETVAQRDAQIASLKTFEGDAQKLKEEVETLQKKNAEESDKYRKELLASQKHFAVKQALLSSERKPHDIDMAMSLFDLDRVSIDEKGNVIGIKEQQEKLLESKGFLFTQPEAKTAPVIKGFNVHPQSNNTPPSHGVTQAGGGIGKSVAMRHLQLSGIKPAE